ncbi:MAG: putative collagen-binding domain-containing protein [Bryobacteraceae bacterium]
MQAARTADKRTLVVYMPTPRAVTVDMAEIAGSRARAWWFDPRNAKVREEAEGPAQGNRRFSLPGEGDWVLLVEDASLANTRPGK